MTTEQENRIIEQAQDILARRFAVEHELKINAQIVAYYGAYYLGALDGVMAFIRSLKVAGRKPKADDWLYLEAELELATRSKRNMQLFLDGTEMCYRNHQRDKKGKLKSVECYFVERRTLLTEKN